METIRFTKETVEVTEFTPTVYELKDYMLLKGFVSIREEISINLKGYKYVTFFTSDNLETDIYFNRGAAEGDFSTSASANVYKGFFKDLVIWQYTRKTDGELVEIIARRGGKFYI